MDDTFLIIAIGFVFAGIIIGYPLGHVFGKREAARSFSCDQHRTYEPCRPVRRRRSRSVLEAEYLEEK